MNETPTPTTIDWTRLPYGACEALDGAVAELTAAGQKAIRLQVAGAFHSSLMCSAAEAFSAELDKHPLSTPKALVAQNFTGTLVNEIPELKKNQK